MTTENERILKLIAFALAATNDAVLDSDSEQYPDPYWSILTEKVHQIRDMAEGQPDLLEALMGFLVEVDGFNGEFSAVRMVYPDDPARRREEYEKQLNQLMADPGN